MNVSPIRVLFLNHTAQVSGGERGLVNMVARLDRTRFTPVVGVPPGRALADALEPLGVQVEPVSMLRFHRTVNPFLLATYAIHALVTTCRLVRLIRREKIDIVHANSSTAQLYAGVAARRAGVPCVWHCRDLVALGRLGRWMAARATTVIAISDAVGELLRPLTGPDRLVVLHNGIDVARFRCSDVEGAGASARERVRTELEIPQDAFLVATVGQRVPWKRHDVFIDAARAMADRVPNSHFLIVGADLFGDHPVYNASLEERVRRWFPEGRCSFAGYRDDMPDVFAAIDLLIHPATREPFGRALAEAMAAGVPVVAVESCGPSEIVRPGVDGLLVESGTSEELVTAALTLASDPDLARRLGASGRDRIQESFSLERFAAKLGALYEEILQGRGRGGL